MGKSGDNGAVSNHIQALLSTGRVRQPSRSFTSPGALEETHAVIVSHDTETAEQARPPPKRRPSWENSPVLLTRSSSSERSRASRKRRRSESIESTPSKRICPDPEPLFPSGPANSEYVVGWICALPIELQMAMGVFDEVYTRGFGCGCDHNLYILGRVGEHNVVLTCLPMGKHGTDLAAITATRMKIRFPNITIGLTVGIGGGVPSDRDDVRLGDVVVSKPGMGHMGVVQHDFGKITPNGFQQTGSLNAPPEKLLMVLSLMPLHGTRARGPPGVEYPGEHSDRLYQPDSIHAHKESVVSRRPGYRERGPHVFYGTIATGNVVIKDAAKRDQLVRKHEALCFDAMAAGLLNSNFPCLVIRGISNYADSHKTDEWRPYAAAAAARYAADLLHALPTWD